MSIRIKLLSALVLALIVVTALANPVAVSAALAVSAVSPNVIVNNVTTTITVTGSDFAITTVVRLGATALTTSFIDAATLTAVVPAGFAMGVYDVSVEVPGAGSAALPGGLTILEPTATPSQPFARPQIVIDSYSVSTDSIRFGQEFNLYVSLDNAGGSTAYGLQVIFTSADLLMLKNGGVIAVDSLGTVGKANMSQTMTAAASLYGRDRVSVDMNVTYYDEKGTSYTDNFTIYILVAAAGGGGGKIYPTATPTAVRHSQLVISDYKTDIDPLQPGAMFKLSLTVQNVGTVAAKGVTMIIGGGASNNGGTPESGISGGNGEFSNFAPVGTSNIKSLGNIDVGASFVADQELIVNVSTNPGAYPMKISFLYSDTNGTVVNDEQVITLLVYHLPQVEIDFYQAAGPFYVGQPGLLPLQVVNLGRNSIVLGMMTVETAGGTIDNGQMLVGALDMGGYFPLDALFTPTAPGTFDLLITINYTDDFNQARTITQTLSVDVLEAPLEPTPDSNTPVGPVTPSSGETLWQKVWRFILGLLGLDSGSSTPQTGGEPTPTIIPVLPLPSGGKG
jgi:IPT/TIG domain